MVRSKSIVITGLNGKATRLHSVQHVCVFLFVLSAGKLCWASSLELDGLAGPVREAIGSAAEEAGSYDLNEQPVEGAEAWGKLGMLLQAQNLYESAIVAYGPAAGASGNPRWFYLRAVCNIELGHLDRAVRDLNQVVLKQPNIAVVWYRLGEAELRRGSLKEAGIALEQALSLDENDAAIRVAYADLLNELGQNEKALEHLLVAAQIEPDAGQIAYRVASTYRRLGDRMNQQTWLEKRNELAPTVADPLLVEVGQYSLSANFFALAGQRAWTRGQFLDALEAYHNAVRLDPSRAVFKLDLAHMLVQLGRTEESMVQVQEVLGEDGSSVRALNLLAQIHVANGDFERSLAVFDRQDTLLEDATSQNLKAAILTRLSRFEVAAREYGGLAERSVGHEREFYYRYWQGMNLYRSGDCSHGLTNLRLVGSAMPNWGEALVALARMECDCGDKKKGAEIAKQLVSANDSLITRLTDVYASLANGETLGLVERLKHEEPSSEVEELIVAVQKNRLPDLIFAEDSNSWHPPETEPIRVNLE